MPQLRSIPHFDTSNANTHSCLLDFGISQWNPILPWWSLFYSHLCCLNTYEIPSLHYSGWWFQPTLKNDGVSSSIGMMTFHSQLFMESHVIQSCSSHHQPLKSYEIPIILLLESPSLLSAARQAPSSAEQVSRPQGVGWVPISGMKSDLLGSNSVSMDWFKGNFTGKPNI